MKELTPATKNSIKKGLLNTKNYLGIVKLANQNKTKYTPEEILNFLICLQYDTFVNDKKISKAVLEKLIQFSTEIVKNEDMSNIDPILMSKIITIKGEYKNYCARNSVEEEKALTAAYDILSGDYKDKNISTAKEITDLTGKIDALEDDKKTLSGEVDILNKKISKIEKQSEKSAIKIAEKDEIIKELRKELKSVKEQLAKVKATKIDSKEETEKLLKSIEELNTKIKNLENSNEDIQRINSDYQEQIKSFENNSTYLLGKDLLEKVAFDNRIIELLMTNKYSANELLLLLNAQGVNCEFNDVFESLQRIQKEINIEPSGVLTIPKLYEVQKPTIIKDRKVLLDREHKNYKDIVFISDIHFTEYEDDNERAYRKLYSLYDYCQENNIDTIINLGDVVDMEEVGYDKTNEVFDAHKRLLENVSENLNKNEIISKNVNQLILGGNHDLSFSRYGIDPIEYLASSNQKLIPIGYDNARIQFKHSRDMIGLHHYGVPREEELNYNHQVIAEQTVQYLIKYYNKMGINRDNIYIDLFGHTHKGKVDQVNGYGIIPSLNKDRYTDGATKIRIYFKENGDIDYLLIYPLTLGRRVEQSYEIAYQKNRSL